MKAARAPFVRGQLLRINSIRYIADDNFQFPSLNGGNFPSDEITPSESSSSPTGDRALAVIVQRDSREGRWSREAKGAFTGRRSGRIRIPSFNDPWPFLEGLHDRGTSQHTDDDDDDDDSGFRTLRGRVISGNDVRARARGKTRARERSRW